ncbi:MAG: acyl-CoA dehydrogenase [Pseudomonadales bacterium]|nr:acyl-CoA dehydrogenase [Pseudomonadales bacterium]
MPEQLSPQLIELRERCAAFAKDHMLPLAESDRASAAVQVREASKTAGLFTMTQPAHAAGQLALCVARETLAAANPPALDAVFGPGAGVLGSVGEPLASSHLAPLLAGEKRGSFGFTEPDDAEPTAGIIDGDALTIKGQKSYVTGGADADFINALVRIEGHGPSMVVIDTDTQGVILEKRFNSLDGSHHAAFRFDNVQVPVSHVIGEPGQGLPKALRQIGDVRLLFAAQACGYLIWVMDLLQSHLQSPDKDGAPRGNKDVVRWHYADLRIKAFAARSMLYRTARLADAGENIVNEGMACKIFATECIGEAVDTAIQLVGGGALVDDHPLALLYKKVRAWRLAEGASDVLRLNIGRGILELGKGRI